MSAWAAGVFLHRGTTGLSASSHPLRATLAVGPCIRKRNPGAWPGLLRPSPGNKIPFSVARSRNGWRARCVLHRESLHTHALKRLLRIALGMTPLIASYSPPGAIPRDRLVSTCRSHQARSACAGNFIYIKKSPALGLDFFLALLNKRRNDRMEQIYDMAT